MNATATLSSKVRPSNAQSRIAANARFTQRAVYVFLCVQFVSQALLIVEELGSFRAVFRGIGYASSLGMLILFWSLPSRPNPMRSVMIAFLAVVALEFFHPNGNTGLSCLASITLHFAIWCPVLWCAHVIGSAKFLRGVLLIFWGFNVAGSIMGVLQVYSPATFSPSPEFVKKLIGVYADGLKITLADGTEAWRPMGLTDTPGGASLAGSFAVLFGLALAVTESNFLLRSIAIVGAAAGMFCIYMCETRSILIVTVVGMIVYLAMMGARQRLTRVGFILVLGLAVFIGGFYWAISVGGLHTSSRFNTLTDDSPGEVYYKNRGHFIESTFTELVPKYPLGAGLGRWGMVTVYFSDPNIQGSEPLWAEIQFTGWLLDGGVLLVIIGYGALLLACWASGRMAVYARDPAIADMAAVITSINLAILAITFNCNVFISQMGILFWVLNGLLYASARRQDVQLAVGSIAT